MAHFELVSSSSRADSQESEEENPEGTTSGSEAGDLETIPGDKTPLREPEPEPPAPPPPPSERELEVRELVAAEFESRMPGKKGGKAATKKSSSTKAKPKAKAKSGGKKKSATKKGSGATKSAAAIAKYRKLATSMLAI